MLESFDRSFLSPRENQILNFAIEGMTDQQIALQLGISTSTVNSYWVRIRGKVGHMSRTELVAQALKQIARGRETELLERNRQLNLLSGEQSLLLERDRKGEMFQAALEANPEALVVIDAKGGVLYANARFNWLLGYESDELLGQHFVVCCRQKDQAWIRKQIQAYLENPHPMKMGIDEIVYGQRKDGTTFRLIFLLDSRPTPNGLVTTCVVRAFMDEIDTLRRHTIAFSQTM